VQYRVIWAKVNNEMLMSLRIGEKMKRFPHFMHVFKDKKKAESMYA